MHRLHVDDVGPVVTPSVAVAKQLRGDRVAVGLVMDKDAAEVVAGLRRESREQGTEVSVVAHPALGTGRQGLSGEELVARVLVPGMQPGFGNLPIPDVEDQHRLVLPGFLPSFRPGGGEHDAVVVIGHDVVNL